MCLDGNDRTSSLVDGVTGTVLDKAQPHGVSGVSDLAFVHGLRIVSTVPEYVTDDQQVGTFWPPRGLGPGRCDYLLSSSQCSLCVGFVSVGVIWSCMLIAPTTCPRLLRSTSCLRSQCVLLSVAKLCMTGK